MDEIEGRFVPWPLYMKEHLEHEKQIATNTQTIVDLGKQFKDINALVKDTNDKVSSHIEEENKIWITVGTQLKILQDKIKNPVIGVKTLIAGVIAIITIIGELAYIFLLLHGRL